MSRFMENQAFKVAVSLIILAITLLLDVHFDKYAGPQWGFLLFYMILNVTVGELIGGKFSYAYAIFAALSRSYTGTLVWDGWTVEIWSSVNLMLGFTFINNLIQRKNNALKELNMSALTDPLTKLPNRRAFNIRLKSEIARARRTGLMMSVAYLDVDGFKKVNDDCGHQRGDELLDVIGKTISKSLRASDLGARIGGDEFSIIFQHKDQGSGLPQRIKHDLDSVCDQLGFEVSFSIGVVDYDGSFDISTDDVISVADSLMYDVKKTSKNAIKIQRLQRHQAELKSVAA